MNPQTTNVQAEKANTYDAIVIGSGITGGWAAKELTEKGLRTIVLEAGQTIVPERDYVEHVPVWKVQFRGMRDRQYEKVHRPVQRQIGDEWNAKFFVDDVENPYTTPPDQPYLFLRGRHVGGRSVMWGRQSYRWSDYDFEANLRDGHGVDWPVRYKDVEPWYDYVEDFIGVSGQAENLPQLPDGKFLPPMEMNCAEIHMRDVVAQKFPDRRLTIGRTAILTQTHRGRAACHYCGPCSRLHHAILLQQPALHPACGRGHGQAHDAPLQRGAQSYLRSEDASYHGGEGDRCADEASHGVSREGGVPLRLHARVGTHPHELSDDRISRRPGQLQRPGGPQPHGPHHGQRGHRHYPWLRRPAANRQPAQRHLHATLPQHKGQAS
jgi:choline dehydrogenase-like flavoprotein